MAPIKSSDWTSDLLDSQLPLKVGSSLAIYFLSNKHKYEKQGCVCIVLNIAGFKSQCKPRVLLCMKTLPPGWKAYHLQGDFASTSPQWGVSTATWTKWPINAPNYKLAFLSLNISLLFFWKMCWLKKHIFHLFLLLDFQPSVNIVIPQILGDGWIILIFIFPL